MVEIPKGAHVILRLKQLKVRTGLSRSTIYGKLSSKSPHYDPSFPKQIRLGASSARSSSVGWIESEVDAWIASRAQARGMTTKEVA